MRVLGITKIGIEEAYENGDITKEEFD